MLVNNEKKRSHCAFAQYQTVNTSTSSSSNIHTIKLGPFVGYIYRFNISHVRWIVLNGNKEGKLVVKRTRCVHAMCMYVWTCVHTVMTQRLRLFTDETQIAQKLNGKMICDVASERLACDWCAPYFSHFVVSILNTEWRGINININFKENWLLSWGTRFDLTFR